MRCLNSWHFVKKCVCSVACLCMCVSVCLLYVICSLQNMLHSGHPTWCGMSGTMPTLTDVFPPLIQKHTHSFTHTNSHKRFTPRFNKVTHQLEAQSHCKTGSWSHPVQQTSRWRNQPLCTGAQKWTSLPIQRENRKTLFIYYQLSTCSEMAIIE